jgi:hypothetical protein
MEKQNHETAELAATELSAEQQEQAAGGIGPLAVVAVAGAIAGVTGFASSGGYQDAVDLVSGAIEGFMGQVN